MRCFRLSMCDAILYNMIVRKMPMRSVRVIMLYQPMIITSDQHDAEKDS